jgi:small-conductance mechanosensitive channel
MVIVALRVAGVRPETLAVGGAFTAVVVGLAAQQTIGNLFAGLVLLSARPFRVGERVRFVGGNLAGTQEGIVGSLGLLYTTLASGADRIMIPNGLVLNAAVIPLREPERVEFTARFSASTTPRDVEARLRDEISTPMRYPPHIALEEMDRDEVVVRIVAVPESPADGAKLAGEVLSALRRNGAADTSETPAHAG